MTVSDSHNRQVGVLLMILTGLLACRPSVAFQQSPLCARSTVVASSSRLHLFFDNKQDNVKADELAIFPKLASGDVKYNSLLDFVSTYAKKFEDDRKGMGLTTPVKLVPTLEDITTEEASEDVTKEGGVRLIFQSTQTGYKSKEEENASPEEKSKKQKKPPKQGGVEFRVQLLSNGDVQLKMRRSDIEEGTVVKEMSEEAIVSQLKTAIQAWRKEALST